MNYRMIKRMLGMVVGIVALFMIPALLIAILRKEANCVFGIGATIVVMALVALLLGHRKPVKSKLYAREGFVIVALTWVIVSMLGALPFFLSREIPSYIDCVFETVSGFTTTGATILSNVEGLSMSLLYWRSFTHWLGGMGVLVFLLAIAPAAAGTGDTVFIMRAEATGPVVSKLVPRTRQTARILYEIYIGMTVLQTVLMLLGGMPAFDAVCTAFGTAGTGGFGIKNDSMASYSPYIQWVVTIFMALFGVNFSVYYLIIMRMYRKSLANEELRLYIGTLLAATAICAFETLSRFKGSLSDALRHSAFQVSSIMTTTGFATDNFDVWPQTCRMLLVLLMIMGACAGSTGGGVKCSRVLILLKSIKNELRRMVNPTIVTTVRMDGESVKNETVVNVLAFFGAYSVIAIVSMMILTLDDFPLETTLTAVLACVNNIGPGLGVVGPLGNFSAFSDLSKLVLAVNMLIGRLEVFPILILFMPKVWKRARA